MHLVSSQFSRPPYNDLGRDEELAPLFPPDAPLSMRSWEEQRSTLRQQWDRVLGTPSYGAFDRGEEVVDTFSTSEYSARVFRQRTSPDTRQLVVLMVPRQMGRSPCPGAVVPFYHPDDVAGYDLEQRRPILKGKSIQFGRHLVQQGYVVACLEAFPFNTVPDPQSDESFAWWSAAADKLLRENPQWTGMGKLVWDACLAVDLLLKQPEVDPRRVAMMGHSLGGKIVLYGACLDERVNAAVVSDPGIGYSFSNWDAPWYLDGKLRGRECRLAHHQLLALCAPRSFLLVAGEFDGPASWQYINAVKPVYGLYGREDGIGCLDHGTGHRPTEESLVGAYRWLAEQLDVPAEKWTL